MKIKKSSNISVTALHRFIPQSASGRFSALPCLDCIFSMVRILAIIAFTWFDFQNPWFQGSRRLSKDYEIKAVHAEIMCIISHIHTLLRRF